MTILSVPDMTCSHCKATVESALKALPDAGTVTVDLPTHKVEVTGPTAPELLVKVLDQAGYPATILR